MTYAKKSCLSNPLFQKREINLTDWKLFEKKAMPEITHILHVKIDYLLFYESIRKLTLKTPGKWHFYWFR